MMTSPTQQSFSDYELAAWTAKAAGYERWYAPITSNAIMPIFGVIGAQLTAKRFLDICTGTGHVAGAASSRGADAVGIDFADAMLAIARTNYPMVRFQQGDAEDLPFADESFDAAANCFGMMHLPNPEKALGEVFRVLKFGGRFTFTNWLPPSVGFDLFLIIDEAVREFGNLNVNLPPAPPAFRFGDAQDAVAVLGSIGFEEITFDRKSIFWRPARPGDVLDLIQESTVRAPMLIERQTPAARARIEQAIVQQVEALRSGGVIELRFPYLLVGAEKLRSSSH